MRLPPSTPTRPTLSSRSTQQEPGSELREIDALVAADEAPGLLSGVPIALKDLIHHRGHVTTAGSSFYRHHADRSAAVVERLEAAGAIVIGRTGLHEFAYGFNSENEWFGPVHNPWDQTLSPGGSSGGSAAAVAAGLVPIAIGTDTGGSVRVPAALCGVVGLKVTHGRIPTSGVFPLAESLDTVGPITRDVDDAALCYRVIAGPAPDDPWSMWGVEDQAAPIPIESLTLGVPRRWLDATPTTAVTRAAFGATLDRLADEGAGIIEINDPMLTPAPEGWWLSAAEAASVHRDWFADPAKAYGKEVESRLAASLEVTLDEYIEARRWQAGLIGAARRAFQSVDVLVTPTVGHPTKAIGVDTITVDGEEVHHRRVLAGYSATVNQMWCPAIALPLPDSGRPPQSVQVIGPWWSEDLLLDIGRQLEKIGIVGAGSPT